MKEYLDKYYNDYLIMCGTDIETKKFIYKQYLNETDYAIIKMYETVVQGGSIIEMLKDYKEVLNNRKEARKKINELEEIGEKNGN
jgi:hypothetical protein